MPNSDLQNRMAVIEQLTRLFKTERLVYLVTAVVSFLLLVGCTISLMVNRQVTGSELAMLFGSSGLIAYTASRLLFMWEEAIKRLMPLKKEGSKDE